MADETQITKQQFAQKIKAKYPDYASVPDADLTTKILAKHPEYGASISDLSPKDRASLSNASAEQEKQRMIASASQRPGEQYTMSAKPAWYTPAGLKSLWYQAVDKGSSLMPAAGGATGAIIGGAGGTAFGMGFGGVPGAIGGAAVGGATGEAAKQLTRRALLPNHEQIMQPMTPEQREAYSRRLQGEGKLTAEEREGRGIPSTSLGAAGHIAIEAGKQAAIEATGQAGGRVLGELAKKVSPDIAMSRILGVSKASLKGGRADVEAVQQIGKIVNEEVKGAGSLESLASKIKIAKEAYNRQIEDSVSTAVASKVTNLHQIIKDAVFAVTKKLQLQGKESAADAIGNLAKNLMSAHPENATAAELLAVKRAIRDKGFAQGFGKDLMRELDHEINAAIVKALPPDKAAQFLKANTKVSNLIRAESAIQQKMLKEALGQHLKHAGIGAGLGAGAGYETTHSGKGALVGAVTGAVASRAASSVPGQFARLYAKKAISAAAPYIAKSGPYAAHAMRAVEAAIQAINSTPNNSLPQEQR